MQNSNPIITDWARNAGGLTYIEANIEELTGYTAEEVLTQPGIFLTSDAYEKLWTIHHKHFSQTIRDRLDSRAVTVRMKHRAGHTAPAEFTLITLYEDGWPVEMVGTIRQCHCHRCPLVGQIVTDALALDEGDRRLVANLAQRLAA